MSLSSKCSIVINARLHSTRLPKKLVRPFGNTTLLDLGLSKISDLDVPTYLAAYTGEQQIMDIYSKYVDKVGFLDRSYESVKKGRADHEVVFAHYRKVPTRHIMSLNVCCPFLNKNTIEDALSIFENKDIQTLTTVFRVNNIFFDESLVPINLSNRDVVSTQGNKAIYQMAHAFHIFDRDVFVSEGKFWDYRPGNPYLYVISDRLECMDIDDPLDFDVCECIYEANRTDS